MSVVRMSIINSLPHSDKLTEEMIRGFEDNSLIPDSLGRLPGTPGYERTVDGYYALMQAIQFLKVFPSVTNSSSEGTGVAQTPPDWDGLTLLCKTNSPILLNAGVIQCTSYGCVK